MSMHEILISNVRKWPINMLFTSWIHSLIQVRTLVLRMVLQFALFHIILILWPLYPLASAQYGINTAQPGCDSFCGDVEIPYPFGMKDPKCYAEKWFEIECRNYSSNDQKPFLKSINLEVKEIYENDGIVSIMNPIYRWNCKSKDAKPRIDMKGSPFVYSQEQKKLLGVGCNNLALLVSNGSEIGGCVSICDNNEESLSNNDLGRDGCLGRYCCETSLPMYLSEYNVTIEDIGRNTSASDECNYAVIADESWLEDYYYMAIRSLSDLKDLLLQQGLSSGEVNFDKTKLFSSKDLEKATERFNVNRILGKGGQGTVYQGMLVDGQIVAVKKFKVHGNVEEFINEVVVLSQINHRNVVKLLGFCLETQVLLLVYEFIPNGNLFQYLHDQNDELPMTWEMLLRIATEVAGALFYLHSAASQPIYHRDIKSTNILLDEKYRAKVADFGTSRMVSIEDIHLTTLVQGTFGYLDPEYFHTSQFTEKSDVYSFGVVLVELLTGQKPISSIRSEEAKSLASYFIMSMEEDHLFDILDPRIMKGGEKEDIVAVAKLAKRCLELNGRKRPSMKEVTMELERIQKLGRKSNTQQNHEEIDLDGIEAYQAWAAYSTSTGRTLKSRTSSSSLLLPSILIK